MSQFRTTNTPYLSPLVTHEWARLPIPATPASASPSSPQHHTFTPRTFSPPPSNSPSPCPSLSSSSSHACYLPPMVEIEELDDDDVDSGIELLHGEFEDAPENNGKEQQEEEEDKDEEKVAVLQGLQRLWQQRWSEALASKKRTYAESLDGSDGDGDYESEDKTDSSSGGRIRRRKLAPLRRDNVGAESSRSTPELMMEMEL